LLYALFKHFDTDNSNYITQENIKEALSKIGQSVSEDQIQEMILQHDITKDGQISFEEFKQIFKTNSI